jgi:hypothetical protein
MPMGMSNSPSTFQRLMDSVLAPLAGKSVQCYLDDIIVYSATAEEQNRNRINL